MDEFERRKNVNMSKKICIYVYFFTGSKRIIIQMITIFTFHLVWINWYALSRFEYIIRVI